MSVRVVDPPAPFLTSTDVIGSEDASIDAMIAAVVEEIDGPDGWLGIAIAPQTLEITLDCWNGHLHLPYPPFIAAVSVKYIDVSGILQTVDPLNYASSRDVLWFKPSWSAPQIGAVPNPISIRWRAGYNDEAVDGGGTGPIPARIKQAVVLAVQHLRALSGNDVFLQLDVVEGVGRKQYAVTDQAAQIIRDTFERLLTGLRRYS